MRNAGGNFVCFGDKYYCYYCADPKERSAIYCRVSEDLRLWGPSKIVNSGGSLGSGRCMAQCPFVIWLEESQRYYLFRSSNDERTGVYASKDPMDFGVGDDSCLVCVLRHKAPEIIVHQDKYYIAALRKKRDGIDMARLTWGKP
ncbi:MAG: hypothetical protein JXM70_14535 [Pirellulales bacterium]|nr:hypothetical protein [Pirellulales bacterium]